MSQYIPPKYGEKAFNCPFCGVYSDQKWAIAIKFLGIPEPDIPLSSYYDGYLSYVYFAKCAHCKKHSIWINNRMIYPITGNAPLPNPDLPDDVKRDYEEAKNIVSLSPPGAAALLKLAIQKLCKHLGEKGENLNDDIANLVEKKLPEEIQKALDIVRVIGNNAVHPGQIDLKDDISIANSLFELVNIICEDRISKPKKLMNSMKNSLMIPKKLLKKEIQNKLFNTNNFTL